MATSCGTRKISRRRHLVLVSATTLALGVTVGFGGWQIGLHRHAASTAAPVQAQVQLEGSPAGTIPAAGSSASMTVTSAPPSTASPIAVYLVASAEQARAVCSGVQQEDALGQPITKPATAVVIVEPTFNDLWHLPPLVECRYL
jgi:hypothetical protein